MIAAIVFVFGLIIGSFLNVCIQRLPRGESIVRPQSHCPHCAAPIRPYDNIPLLSYLLLRARCRHCGARISPLYPLVELLTGALFLACYLRFGPTLDAVKWAVFGSLLLVLIVTDARERILPDAINFPGLAIGLILSLLIPDRDNTMPWIAAHLFSVLPPAAVLSLCDAILGAAVGGGSLWLVSEGYYRLRGREGMGLGDVKMMAMVGAFFGLKRTFLTLLLGSVIGSLLGIIIVCFLFLAGWRSELAERAHRRSLGSVAKLRWAIATRYQLPFGSYLGLAALAIVFFGPAMEAAVGFR